MANTATRSTLRDRARQLADRVSSTSVTDAELNSVIDVELSALHDILVTRFEDYFDSTAATSVVSGTASYALPSTFYKLLYLDLTLGSHVYTLKRFHRGERNRYQDNVGVYGRYYYSLLGSNVKLIPTPTVAGTLTVGYAPQYTPLAADGTVVSSAIPQGWEQLAVVGTALYMLKKDESDPSSLMAEQALLLDRINNAAEDRDTNEPSRVLDVSNRFRRQSGEEDCPDAWGW